MVDARLVGKQLVVEFRMVGQQLVVDPWLVVLVLTGSLIRRLPRTVTARMAGQSGGPFRRAFRFDESFLPAEPRRAGQLARKNARPAPLLWHYIRLCQK